MSYIGGASSNDYSEISLYQFAAVYDRTLGTTDGMMMLEKESNLRVEAVMRGTDSGGSRVVAYRLTARLIVPQNSYKLYKWVFDRLKSGDWSNFGFVLRKFQRSDGKLASGTESGIVDAWNVSAGKLLAQGVTEFAVQTVEARPRVEMSMVVWLTADVFSTQGEIDNFWAGFDVT